MTRTSDKTEKVRVPSAGSSVARQLIEIAISAATNALMNTKWYRTSGSAMVPSVRFLRIETRDVAMSIGGVHSNYVPMPFIICEAEVSGLIGTFALRVDFGRGGVEVEEERVINEGSS